MKENLAITASLPINRFYRFSEKENHLYPSWGSYEGGTGNIITVQDNCLFYLLEIIYSDIKMNYNIQYCLKILTKHGVSYYDIHDSTELPTIII